jgi:glycosyltransferase involved in cell wall biosynthesis
MYLAQGATSENDMRNAYDLICLSHLRWDFVFQRPQHLLSRAARERRVIFVEEPIYGPGAPRMDVSMRPEHGVEVAVPILTEGMTEPEASSAQRSLIDDLIERYKVDDHVLWYYTPMAMAFTRHLRPLAVVYDCMDELSAFRGAPQMMRSREAELLRKADVVFTGGHSLYEAKRSQHPNIYAFPSSVDKEHFATARSIKADPPDQAHIPHPRVGYFGVVDERMDLTLLTKMADARPDLQLVMVGPVVKIESKSLPRRANIHWLGQKSYKELPAYIAGWDVAMLPFARNESTKFISPTKTPEYLAAGKPVVSTSIRDVVRPYSEDGLARIADAPSDFIAAIDASLAEDPNALLRKADAMLARTSWDQTWARMSQLLVAAVSVHRVRQTSTIPPAPSPVVNPINPSAAIGAE